MGARRQHSIALIHPRISLRRQHQVRFEVVNFEMQIYWHERVMVRLIIALARRKGEPVFHPAFADPTIGKRL